MVDFFYNIPIWLTTILVLGASLVIGLGSSFGLRRFLRIRSNDEDIATAVSLMQVVAAYIGILIAFSGVQVWQEFTETEEAVHREASAAAQLYRDLTTYGSEAQAARQDLRAYTASILNDEWPLLAKGESSAATEVALARMFASMGKIRPKDDRDSIIYSEAFAHLNELVGLRRDRLIHSRSGMPLILWIVGLVGSALIVSYTATFPHTRANVMMIGGISVTLGLIFLFILIVDRPFTGEYQVSNAELVALQDRFDRLDRLSSKGAL